MYGPLATVESESGKLVPSIFDLRFMLFADQLVFSLILLLGWGVYGTVR